jgi:GT2 family glycosyltransferase
LGQIRALNPRAFPGTSRNPAVRERGERLGVILVEYADEAGANAILEDLGRASDLEVVVVSTGPKALRASGGVATLVHLPTNPGFGAALNVGVESLSRAVSYFVISNTDVRCSAEDLRELWGTATRSGLAVVSPTIVGPDGRVHWDGGRIDFLRLTAIHERYGRERRTEAILEPTVFVTGAFVMVRRDVWRAVGGMREDFFLYAEDADFSMRLRRGGFAARVFTGVTVVHRPSASVGRYSPLQVYLMTRNNIRFFREWSPHTWGRAACWTAVPLRLAWQVLRGARAPWKLVGWILLGVLDARRRSAHYSFKGRAARVFGSGQDTR